MAKDLPRIIPAGGHLCAAAGTAAAVPPVRGRGWVADSEQIRNFTTIIDNCCVKFTNATSKNHILGLHITTNRLDYKQRTNFFLCPKQRQTKPMKHSNVGVRHCERRVIKRSPKSSEDRKTEESSCCLHPMQSRKEKMFGLSTMHAVHSVQCRPILSPRLAD